MAAVRGAVSRHYGLAQVVLAVAAAEAYELTRSVLAPNWPLALRHAHEVAALERLAGVAWEVPLQRAFLGSPDAVRALNLFYLAGHFVGTAAFLLWLYHRSRRAFRRFRNGLLAATALALAVHWRFPTAPPRLADVGLVDTLHRLSGLDIGSPGSAGFSDPVAAVPSLHAGWALGVGVGLVLYARSRAWRAVGAAYPAAVVLATIVTGNHFLLDAAAGMLVLGLGFALTGESMVKFLMRRGVEQSGSSPGS
jgi:PAP2 superfamily